MTTTIKKWHWTLGIIGAIIIALIAISFLFYGAGERSISTLYIIPAGTFGLFHETNNPTGENLTGGNISVHTTTPTLISPEEREKNAAQFYGKNISECEYTKNVFPEWYNSTTGLIENQSQDIPGPGSTQDPGSLCNPQVAVPRVPVAVDTSVPIQDPMPGVRYSLGENDSGRTIMLDKGDVVEINLRWIPGLGFRWIIPVSGCGLELVNDGYYDTGTDFWNTSGHYRARYRAVSPGTSIIDGKFVISPNDNPTVDFQFNLTVIVK
jgi:predicted secreted protein